MISPHAVEVNGVPRHVRDLRGRSGDAGPGEDDSDDEWEWFDNPRRRRTSEAEGEQGDVQQAAGPDVVAGDGPRRSARIAARTRPYRPCPCDDEEDD